MFWVKIALLLLPVVIPGVIILVRNLMSGTQEMMDTELGGFE